MQRSSKRLRKTDTVPVDQDRIIKHAAQRLRAYLLFMHEHFKHVLAYNLFMKIYRSIISVISFALSIYILILNLFCTCFTTADRFQMNYFSGDIVIFNLLAIALALTGVIFCDRIKIREFANKHFTLLKIILLALIAAIGVVFSLSCGLGTTADQLNVQVSVADLRNGNTELFRPTRYMDIYPNQYGLALLSYLASFAVGTYNYTFFRLVNVLCLVLLYNELSLIGKQIGLGKTSQLLILLTGIFFMPSTLYALYIYGNIAALALSVLSVRLIVQAFEKNKAIYSVLSLIAMFFSCVIKSNQMIFAVGIAIYCLFKSISVKKYKNLILVPAMLLCVWLSSFIPLLVMRNLTGLPLNGGVSYISYLAMGVQENDQNYPGGYNGFNADTYEQFGGDKEAQSAYAAEVYKASLTEMMEEPAYFLNFFTRKQLHQWADPAYKAYMCIQTCPEHDTAQWFYEFIRPEHAYPVLIALSFFQVIVWTGVVLSLWFVKKQKHLEEALIMPLIFIGGFIFHTFWEAKSQYVFSYFMILFPISLLGLRLFKEWFASRDKTPLKEKIKKLNNTKISWSFSFTLAAAATILVFGEVLGLATMRTQLPQDRALYKDYVNRTYVESWNPLGDGTYILTSGDTRIECELINKGDKTLIKEKDGDRYLTVDNGITSWQAKNGDLTQAFKFYTDGDKLAVGFDDDYILWFAGGKPQVKYVLYGTLMHSGLDDSMIWHYEKIG